MKHLRLLLVFWLTGPALASAETVSEHILFLDDDGRGYLHYYTTRSAHDRYVLHYPPLPGQDPERHLDDVLYVYPEDYRWERGEDGDRLLVPQGSYALLEREEMGENLEVLDDGTHVFRSWVGQPRPDGHFGFWNAPEDFDRFVYVWVIPDRFEPLAWRANRSGEWVRRGNTLSWYGRGVNDLSFEIRYRARARRTLDRLREALGEAKGVELSQAGDGVRVTLAGTILFPSGDASLSGDGRWLLRRVAATLAGREGVELVVNGYTDDRPIRGALRRRFASNWALSAARALAVLHYLVAQGFPESRIHARAYGARHPRASNASELGRALNRRIELLVFEAGAGDAQR